MESVKENKLGEICKIVEGIKFKPSEYTPEGMPTINVKHIQEDRIYAKNLLYCNPANYPKAVPVKPGDIVIAGWGTPGKVGMNTTNMEFFNASNVFNLLPDENALDKKYLYHFLLNSKKEINELITDGSIKVLCKSSLEKLNVPLPTLEEQKRIATILDQFMELERELVLRKKQYEYYRDLLIQKSLQCPESKECELGEVCDIISGISFKITDYLETGFPLIKVKDIQDNKIQTKNLSYCDPKKHEGSTLIKPGDVVIVNSGKGSVGKIGINLTNQEFYFDGHVLKVNPKDENILNKKYLYYFLLNSSQQISNYITDGIIPGIRKTKLIQLKIIVPPTEIQKDIISKLDKFSDAGIYGELEKEISLRHSQYEYYRNIEMANF